MTNYLKNNSAGVAGGSSIYTDYGFDPTGDNELIAQLKRYAMGLHPGISEAIGLFNELMGKRSGALRNALTTLDPANNRARVEKRRRQETETASRTAKQLASSLSGLGSGALAGFQRDAANRAITNTNRFANELESNPYGPLLALLQYAAEIPGLAALLGMASPLEANTQFRRRNAGSGSVLNNPLLQQLL